eukprot:3264404-Karenia_brevis.AAC.1
MVFSHLKVKKQDGSFNLSKADIEEGAISICHALSGEYIDLRNKSRKIRVNGDMTKLRFMPLSDAARMLLTSLEHTSRKIPGTMEVRKLMRYATHAGRIRKGIPIFITWSPDEKHNILMLRLSRSRMNDPINHLDSNQISAKFGKLMEPQ